MTESLITVVVATHNRSALMEEAVRSVLASPIIGPNDVIVVDDQSTDNTQDVIARLGVRMMRAQAGNCAGTRNVGLTAVTTPYVMFLDDDDLWLPANGEAQLKVFEQHPEAGFVYGRCQMTTMDLEPIAEPYPYLPMADGDGIRPMLARTPQVGVVLFRTDAIRACRAFDPKVNWGEDQDLYIRMAAKFPVYGVDHVGEYFRQRQTSAYESNMRVLARQEWGRVRRKWKRMGITLPRGAVFSATREFRGLWTFQHAKYAHAAAEDGRRKDAAKHLWYALRNSPVHALKPGSESWRAAVALGRSFQPGRRAQLSEVR